MTKSKRIMELYQAGVRRGVEPAELVKDIAATVGCLPEYVRVCARQRKGSGASETDRRYLQSPLGRTTTTKNRHKNNKLARDFGDRRRARKAGNAAYRDARLNGATAKEAAARSGGAYHLELLRTSAKVRRQLRELEAAE